VNIMMGTILGLTFWSRGIGGVYRDDASGVARPPLAPGLVGFTRFAMPEG
jgi:hypothetical protein